MIIKNNSKGGLLGGFEPTGDWKKDWHEALQWMLRDQKAKGNNLPDKEILQSIMEGFAAQGLVSKDPATGKFRVPAITK